MRNSAQFGTAVRVTKSNNDLQSVAANVSGSSCAFKVAVVYVSGSFQTQVWDFSMVFMDLGSMPSKVLPRTTGQVLSSTMLFQLPKYWSLHVVFSYNPMTLDSPDIWCCYQYPCGWPLLKYQYESWDYSLRQMKHLKTQGIASLLWKLGGF